MSRQDWLMDSGWIDEVDERMVWGRVVRDGKEYEFWVPLLLVSESARVDLQPGSYVTILNGELAVNGAIWTTHDIETADRDAHALRLALTSNTRGSE